MVGGGGMKGERGGGGFSEQFPSLNKVVREREPGSQVLGKGGAGNI